MMVTTDQEITVGADASLEIPEEKRGNGSRRAWLRGQDLGAPTTSSPARI